MCHSSPMVIRGELLRISTVPLPCWSRTTLVTDAELHTQGWLAQKLLADPLVSVFHLVIRRAEVTDAHQHIWLSCVSFRHQTQVIRLAQQDLPPTEPSPPHCSVLSQLSVSQKTSRGCIVTAGLQHPYFLSTTRHKSVLFQWYFRILYIVHSVSIVFTLPAITSISYWFLALCCQHTSLFPPRFSLPALAHLFLGCSCLSAHSLRLWNSCY